MTAHARARRSLPIVSLVPALEAPELAPSTSVTPPRTVRLSLTDRCDLACVYCRPARTDGYLESRLDDDAWRVMVQGLVQAGIRRVRVTGGEPLLHPRAIAMIRFLAEQGLDDLALTTNATRLEGLAQPLRDAGLQRLTISLDSLDPERFARITRGGRLDGVLRGIEAARRARFEELKINAVVLRGENDEELEALTRWSWERGILPRFIEVMRVGEGARLPHDRMVSAGEMRAKLAHLLAEGDARPDPDRGPARYLHARHDPRLRVGFISGTTDTYCAGCDRLRVASDGTLRPCLATSDGVSARSEAEGGDAHGVARSVAEAWQKKPDGDAWKGCTETTAASVSMRAIGG